MRRFSVFLIFFLSAILPVEARAQADGEGDKPKVVIPEPPYYIGRSFVYAILLPDGDPQFTPEQPLPNTPGVAIQFIDSRGFEQDGQKVRLFRFNVLPMRAGEVFIPPVHFRSNNTRISAELRRLQVLEPAESDEVKIGDTLSQSECYVGQPLLFEFKWELGVPASQIHAVDIDVPLMTHPDFKLLDTAHPSGFGPDGSIGIPVSNTRIVADVVREDIMFMKTVLPQRPGRYNLPPSVLLCSINRDQDKPKRGGFQYPSYFDNQFFQTEEGGDYERVYTRATPIELNVLPLPEKGRPELFNGQFGTCKIEVEANPAEVRAGDPVTLVVTLSENPFIESVELPNLGEMPGFSDGFDVPSERSPGVLKGRTKKFRQSVIVRHAGITELPPIRLAYFDPVAGEYGVQESEAIPLSVKAALSGVTVLNDGTLLRNEVQATEEGVKHNYSTGAVIAWRPTLSNGLGGGFLWGCILLLPPVMLVLAWFLTRHQRWSRRDPDGARAAMAMRRFNKRVSGSPPAREVVAATRGYLGDRLGMREANLTADEAAEQLDGLGIDPSTVQDVVNILDEGEGKLFSRNTNGADASGILGKARELVRKIEGRISSKS